MSRQEKENAKTDTKTVTAKESGATAIYHVVKADLIHSGATEEIAELGAMKAMCAFETAWSMSVEQACKWLEMIDVRGYLNIVPGFGYVLEDEDAIKDFRKTMEE